MEEREKERRTQLDTCYFKIKSWFCIIHQLAIIQVPTDVKFSWIFLLQVNTCHFNAVDPYRTFACTAIYGFWLFSRVIMILNCHP